MREYEDTGPVSYTHLDVYKRQHKGCPTAVRSVVSDMNYINSRAGFSTNWVQDNDPLHAI